MPKQHTLTVKCDQCGANFSTRSDARQRDGLCYTCKPGHNPMPFHITPPTYIIISSPDDDWPRGCMLYKRDVMLSLAFGCFTPGTRIKHTITNIEYIVDGEASTYPGYKMYQYEQQRLIKSV